MLSWDAWSVYVSYSKRNKLKNTHCECACVRVCNSYLMLVCQKKLIVSCFGLLICYVIQFEKETNPVKYDMIPYDDHHEKSPS